MAHRRPPAYDPRSTLSSTQNSDLSTLSSRSSHASTSTVCTAYSYPASPTSANTPLREIGPRRVTAASNLPFGPTSAPSIHLAHTPGQVVVDSSPLYGPNQRTKQSTCRCVCEYCGKRFVRGSALKKHCGQICDRLLEGAELLKCDTCGHLSRNDAQAKQHARSCGSYARVTVQQRTWYTARYTGELFDNLEDYLNNCIKQSYVKKHGEQVDHRCRLLALLREVHEKAGEFFAGWCKLHNLPPNAWKQIVNCGTSDTARVVADKLEWGMPPIEERSGTSPLWLGYETYHELLAAALAPLFGFYNIQAPHHAHDSFRAAQLEQGPDPDRAVKSKRYTPPPHVFPYMDALQARKLIRTIDSTPLPPPPTSETGLYSPQTFQPAIRAHGTNLDSQKYDPQLGVCNGRLAKVPHRGQDKSTEVIERSHDSSLAEHTGAWKLVNEQMMLDAEHGHPSSEYSGHTTPAYALRTTYTPQYRLRGLHSSHYPEVPLVLGNKQRPVSVLPESLERVQRNCVGEGQLNSRDATAEIAWADAGHSYIQAVSHPANVQNDIGNAGVVWNPTRPLSVLQPAETAGVVRPKTPTERLKHLLGSRKPGSSACTGGRLPEPLLKDGIALPIINASQHPHDPRLLLDHVSSCSPANTSPPTTSAEPGQLQEDESPDLAGTLLLHMSIERLAQLGKQLQLKHRLFKEAMSRHGTKEPSDEHRHVIMQFHMVKEELEARYRAQRQARRHLHVFDDDDLLARLNAAYGSQHNEGNDMERFLG